MNRTQIREIFLRNGFNIKPGCDDLKSYVYAAAEELLNLAEAERLSTEQGEPVAYLRRDQLQQIKTRGPVVGCISPSPRVDMVAVYTTPQPAEQQPAPDVSRLVEVLESALGCFDDWCEGQDLSDEDTMDVFPWVLQARAALETHRKGE